LKAAILHAYIPPEAPEDEKDTLIEVKAVYDALASLGYEPMIVPVTLYLGRMAETLKEIRPAFCFNLVESIDGKGSLIHLAPAVLDAMGIPYTGSSTEALFITSNKLLTKKTLQAAGIPTADWAAPGHENTVPPGSTVIIKSVWEHASVGMDDSAVVQADSAQGLIDAIHKREREHGGKFFAEGYIKGREFNISILAGPDGPEALPPAEIMFYNYPAEKLRIMNYAAKWHEDSFEYENVERTFEFQESDAPLLARLKEYALECWRLFGLSGYARVDFRVDEHGNPFVLEVNANPCLSPEAGFAAAAARAGVDYTGLVKRVVEYGK
jgi:D-alanine-D-alanine ligase